MSPRHWNFERPQGAVVVPTSLCKRSISCLVEVETVVLSANDSQNADSPNICTIPFEAETRARLRTGLLSYFFQLLRHTFQSFLQLRPHHGQVHDHTLDKSLTTPA